MGVVLIFTFLWLFLSILLFFAYSLVFTIFIRVGVENWKAYAPHFQHVTFQYFTQGQNFWLYWGYVELAISVLILFFAIVIIIRNFKNRRQNKTNSDEFGGIHGSARWATGEEISAYWGVKRRKRDEEKKYEN